MTVRLKSTMAGPRGTFQSGDVTEFDADTERDLVQGGYAEYVCQPPQPAREQAVATPVEHAVSPAHPVIPQPQAGRSVPKRGR